MIKEIEKQLSKIKKKMPFNEEIRTELSMEERTYWVWENLRLEGHNHVTKEQIQKALGGEETYYGSIDEGLMIWKIDQLREKIYSYDKERYDFDLDMLRSLKLLLGDNRAVYRKSAMPAMYLSYMPPPHQEVPRMMEDYIPFYHRRGEEDVFSQAAKIHNRFVEIFPYKSGNLILARTLMEYYIIRSGYPMVTLGLSQENYFKAIKAFIHKGDSSALAETLRHRMKKRLEEIEKIN